MTIDDLRQILYSAAGVAEHEPGADFGSATFGDLGYDSLALMEVSAAISHRFEVAVPEGAFEYCTTAQDAVELVNRLVGANSDGS
jgi:act minimal PKS acyl carrier protein